MNKKLKKIIGITISLVLSLCMLTGCSSSKSASSSTSSDASKNQSEKLPKEINVTYVKSPLNVPSILEKNEYAENVLNSKELDIAQDFQYICLSSAANYKLVNEIIARLAQNGNADIVKENVKMISMSMWKDLFDQNEAIKKIFIENYNNIFENSTIITIREIERFINDKETCYLIYNSLDSIIKKLCTYDRASLISILKNKENGIDKIRTNLENFFQKGEFDITTTYSKILYELGQISEISKVEILKACDTNLSEMLNRETAVDNETNKLLNWLYDAFEESPMVDEDRKEIKQYIDEAIMKNFDHILDKSNYDKNTIKILKQFDCTKEQFENNKNHFIEKSNRSDKEEKTYYFNLNDEKEHIKEVSIDVKKINDIVDEAKKGIVQDNAQFQKINQEIKNSSNEKIVSINNERNNINQKQEHNDSYNKIININEVHKIYDQKNNANNNDDNYTNQPNIKNIEQNINNKNSNSVANSYIEEFSKKKENMILSQNKKQNENKVLDENIQKLISSNIQQTDQIIDRVMKRNVEDIKNREITSNSRISQKSSNNMTDEQLVNAISELLKNEKQENLKINMDIVPNVELKYNINSNNQVQQNSINQQEKQNKSENMQLVVKEENEFIQEKRMNIIKKFWKKIVKLFKSKNSTERIGE